MTGALGAEDHVATHERNVVDHRPNPGRPDVCPVCTGRGVGSNSGPVRWPCTPYVESRAYLKRLGRQRPVPEEW